MPNLRLGIRAHDLPATSLDELLQQANQYHFTNFQFAPLKLASLGLGNVQLTSGLANAIFTKMQKQGRSVSLLGCITNLADPDSDNRLAEIHRFENFMSVARYFGNAIVATETGSVSTIGYTTDNFKEPAFERVVASVRTITASAEKLGTLFAIEPGDNHPIHYLDTTLRLLQAVDSPNLKLVFDPVNLITKTNYQEQDQLVDDFLTEFADKIVAVHLKDFAIINQQCHVCAFGQGQFHRERFIKLIAQRFPHLFCTFEGIQPQQIPAAIAELQQWVTLDKF